MKYALALAALSAVALSGCDPKKEEQPVYIRDARVVTVSVASPVCTARLSLSGGKELVRTVIVDFGPGPGERQQHRACRKSSPGDTIPYKDLGNGRIEVLWGTLG